MIKIGVPKEQIEREMTTRGLDDSTVQRIIGVITETRSKFKVDREGSQVASVLEGAGQVRSVRDGKPLQLVALPGLQYSQDSARVAMRTISGGT